MIGWQYVGPFDDLPAQQQPGGFPANPALAAATGVSCHRVVDGGRDSEGKPTVVAGEGTGIVHTAPGCGDIDFTLGQERWESSAIAPLGEDGRFVEGFGPFTGKEAIDTQTAELVFEELRQKNLLVAVEEYPHIYPHCWRTGDELVFRLVDEWFINMDWREEIMDVVKQIRWLPESIDGQERELEWLIEHARLDDLQEALLGTGAADLGGRRRHERSSKSSARWPNSKNGRSTGWDEFAGHTPHRPWIDKVKIRNPQDRQPDDAHSRRGEPLARRGDRSLFDDAVQHQPRRLEDVVSGRPRARMFSRPVPQLVLFDAVAVDDDAVRRDRRPCEKRPFKTLFGHRLVMNEDGKPMHKSDGTAIWFEEAAEQLGVDTMRWMYLAQNPAIDLRFGKRHPDRPVTLQTPDGPITQTAEGAPTCEVVSKPADEIRRQILIPLWNTYAFFVNYARLDDFDPAAAAGPGRRSGPRSTAGSCRTCRR